uniref:Uncharacterized protein n=1 Tax=Glossina austeni TaxID=7395 RepID=A0A1A9VH23_GLOAU
MTDDFLPFFISKLDRVIGLTMSNEDSSHNINTTTLEDAENNNGSGERQSAPTTEVDSFQRVGDLLKQDDEVLVTSMAEIRNLKSETNSIRTRSSQTGQIAVW